QRETDDLTGSLETLDRILASSPAPRVEWSARLERAFVLIYLGEGSTDDVLATAEQAAGVFAEIGDESGLATTWNAVGVELFWRGKTSQMADAFAKGLEHARSARDDRREWSALNGLSIALALGPTPADDAAERIRANLVRAEELGPAALVTAVLAGVEAMCGRIDDAWLLYGRARELLGEPGSLIGGAGLLLYAEALLELDPVRAAEELRPAYEALQGLGEKGVLATVAAFLAEALLTQGDLREAEELTRVSEQTAMSEDVYSKVVWKRVRARVLARRGEDGRALALEAVELARSAESPQLLAGALVALAQVEQASGRSGEVELREALGLYEAKRNRPASEQLRRALDLSLKTR
ncbi:MAG TPA: hypothetical protein VFV62_11815, partial [Gaiellaceae bacterium]|nr:hypothetical protein [Gaiellaceae bacterium]